MKQWFKRRVIKKTSPFLFKAVCVWVMTIWKKMKIACSFSGSIIENYSIQNKATIVVLRAKTNPKTSTGSYDLSNSFTFLLWGLFWVSKGVALCLGLCPYNPCWNMSTSRNAQNWSMKYVFLPWPIQSPDINQNTLTHVLGERESAEIH